MKKRNSLPDQSSPFRLTLVSHYGNKPAALRHWLGARQREIMQFLGPAYLPYELEQIHATLVGLEGFLGPGGLFNVNWLRFRDAERRMDLAALLRFLRPPSFSSFDVRLGGFDATHDFGFLSQGRHPGERSFSIRGDIIVAMGWPWNGNGVTGSLEALRRAFQDFGILHKWHRLPDDVDNDFYLVLGRLNRLVLPDPALIAQVEAGMRQNLAGLDPLMLTIGPATLSFIGYEDTTLPVADSRVLPLTDSSINSESILRAGACPQ